MRNFRNSKLCKEFRWTMLKNSEILLQTIDGKGTTFVNYRLYKEQRSRIQPIEPPVSW